MPPFDSRILQPVTVHRSSLTTVLNSPQHRELDRSPGCSPSRLRELCLGIWLVGRLLLFHSGFELGMVGNRHLHVEHGCR